MVKEVSLYKRLENNIVQCTACARRCKIPPNKYGFCGVRWNINGKLYLMVYGKLSAIAIDPIEKKPLYQFNPGSMVLSLSTYGCCWMCQFCQNYDISQRRLLEGFDVNPEMLVNIAETYNAHGITFTYNEPIIFMEYAYDVAKIAKRKGFFITFVTNGYMTDESIDLASKFLDAATIDFKGHGETKFLRRYCGVPDPEPIFQTILELKRKGVFIEITDLVVPKIGADLEQARKLCKWIVDNLGPETPIHFLRFHPDYNLLDIPWTPIELLEKHVEIAKQEGLKYVYIGNVPGHPYEHTYCPNCGKIVIKRYGFDILEVNVTEDNRCKYCGYKINIGGKIWPTWKLTDRFVYIPINLLTKYVKINVEEVKKMMI